MGTDGERVSRRVNYSGRVQGVGFRYTTASIAKRYAVDGYVKNLANGTVELVVSGDARTVDRFLADVAAAFEGNIHDATPEELDPSEPISGFHIRR